MRWVALLGNWHVDSDIVDNILVPAKQGESSVGHGPFEEKIFSAANAALDGANWLPTAYFTTLTIILPIPFTL